VSDSYPRRKARTRNFTLGAPRSFAVAADGSRITFLRSPAPDDPRTALHAYDVATREERLIATAPDDEPTPEERARRERARETASGITSYALDDAAKMAAFAVAGRLFAADLDAGRVDELPTPAPAFDPRPDPTGSRVAFVADGALHVVEGGTARTLVAEPGVTWGLADFVAAEEMGRHYGYRWSPDGTGLLVARVDESPVAQWWIADPTDPDAPPRAIRYPAAGTDNADVTLHIVTLDGQRTQVDLPEPYLARFAWDVHGPLAVVQSRDQRRLLTIAADTGQVLHEQSDDAWVELVPGVPARLGDGRLVTADHGVLKVAGDPVAPGLELRAVSHVTDATVVFTASTDPTEQHVYAWQDGQGVTPLTTTPGVHDVVSGGVDVLAHRTLQQHSSRWTLNEHIFTSRARTPDVLPEPRLLTVGERELRVAVVLPKDHDGSKLPVLLTPYGGPHHQRVVKSSAAYYDDQWFADQGFAVLVADGRGTPGRGRDFTTAVHGDLATAPLEDQVDALHATAALVPELDLDRVAIRGWSFGGFLAALAVLRRPDVFHAAVAGAPVTDWGLYDTHYTERYLGTTFPSLIDEAAALTRPLMLIHGLADDNVLAAHSLRFSKALTAAGRPHTFLPLPGVSHMTPQEDVAENLLLLQVDFVRRALGALPAPARS
jgi:dipeptidyl-peptidase-4